MLRTRSSSKSSTLLGAVVAVTSSDEKPKRAAPTIKESVMKSSTAVWTILVLIGIAGVCFYREWVLIKRFDLGVEFWILFAIGMACMAGVGAIAGKQMKK